MACSQQFIDTKISLIVTILSRRAFDETRHRQVYAVDLTDRVYRMEKVKFAAKQKHEILKETMGENHKKNLLT